MRSDDGLVISVYREQLCIRIKSYPTWTLVHIQFIHTVIFMDNGRDRFETDINQNTGKADCFVRVKVIAASQFDIQASGSNWSLSDDGYWYYSQVVPVGGKTEPIVAAITVSEKVKTSFNVVVVQECAPVTYDENGNPCVAPDAKWDATAQYDKEEGEE